MFCRFRPLRSGSSTLAKNPGMDLGGDDRGGRVGAHAAGIGPLVVVEDPLVILRRSQRQQMFAVGQRP